MIPAVRRAAALLPVTGALLALGACSSPAVRPWNLEQLHDANSHHRYTAALAGETEYFWRREVFRRLGGAGQGLSEIEPVAVEDPSAECLENLIEYQRWAEHRAEPDPRAVEWFARLSVEDPAALSRERAALALGRLGERLGADMPARLGSDIQPAGPEQLAPALESLVRATRKVSEREEGAETELEAAAAALRALDLDLAGGRRALRATAELARPFGAEDERAAPLCALSAHLQTICVRRALGEALEDRSELVRAAAVRAVATAGGAKAVDVVLFDRARREGGSEPLIALCDVLEQRGREGANGLERDWAGVLYGIGQGHPEGRVRARALRALEGLTGAGVASLREEDWHAWWDARASAARAASVPPGPPSATSPSDAGPGGLARGGTQP